MPALLFVNHQQRNGTTSTFTAPRFIISRLELKPKQYFPLISIGLTISTLASVFHCDLPTTKNGIPQAFVPPSTVIAFWSPGLPCSRQVCRLLMCAREFPSSMSATVQDIQVLSECSMPLCMYLITQFVHISPVVDPYAVISSVCRGPDGWEQQDDSRVLYVCRPTCCPMLGLAAENDTVSVHRYSPLHPWPLTAKRRCRGPHKSQPDNMPWKFKVQYVMQDSPPPGGGRISFNLGFVENI